MNDQEINKTPMNEGPEGTEPVILRNEVGKSIDPTVVVDEADRTVMLTDNETIIIEKEPKIDLPPKNRPRKVYSGMWGPVEVGVVGAGMLAVLGAVLLYVFFVVPSDREIENNRLRRERLEAEMATAKEKFGSLENDNNRVATLISSVNDFESRFLPLPTNGRTALYQRINGLIAAYGLIPSSGPDYAPLEPLDSGKDAETADKSGKSKFRTFFPGVYVTVTLEGPYANLRKFIREIESGSEFVVVSAVELEPSDSEEKNETSNPTQAGAMDSGVDLTQGRPMAANTSMPIQQSQSSLPNSYRGKTHGAIVSLRLEMAAYFRRSNASSLPADAAPVQQ